jgi:hypothetical protein
MLISAARAAKMAVLRALHHLSAVHAPGEVTEHQNHASIPSSTTGSGGLGFGGGSLCSPSATPAQQFEQTRISFFGKPNVCIVNITDVVPAQQSGSAISHTSDINPGSNGILHNYAMAELRSM